MQLLMAPFRLVVDVIRGVLFLPLVLIALVVLGLNLMTMLPADWFGAPLWLWELPLHFRLQLWGALVLCTGLMLLTGFRWLMLVGLVATVVQGAMTLPTVTAWGQPNAKPVPPEVRTLRVLQMNVFANNVMPELALKQLRDTDAEVVVLQEVDDVWRERLTQNRAWLRAKFPHRLVDVSTDVALLSRYRFGSAHLVSVNSTEIFPDSWDRLWVAQVVKPGARPWTVVGIHPPVPFSQSLLARQNGYTTWVKRALSPQGAPLLPEATNPVVRLTPPLVVLGDFNTTPFSRNFHRWRDEVGLHPAIALNEDCRDAAMAGWCYRPSWPSLVQLPVLMIPIDHAFVSPGVRVLRRAPLPFNGSDHLSVMNVLGQ